MSLTYSDPPNEIPQPNFVEEEIDYEALPEGTPFRYQLIAGAFAGVMEHCTLFPVDAIKTRIQSQGINSIYRNTNILQQISRISTTEGSMSLWKGVQSVILGAGPAHAVYFGTYELLQDLLINDRERNQIHPIKAAFSGAVATTASDALMNPFDTIKQRIQINTKQSIWKIAKKMYNTEGFSSFYVSYPTTLSMNIPFTALNFMIYDTSTKLLNPTNTYNPFIHCICGGISGALCAAATTPLDNIKTVLQIRGSENVSLGILKNADTFKKATKAIYQVYGTKGFWRGLSPRVISFIPGTAILWTSYECAKHLLI